MREHQQQLNDILHSSQESNGIPGMNKMTKNYCPHNLTVKILNFIVFISWSLNIILIIGLISFSVIQEQHPIIALMNSAVQRSSATAAPAAAGRPDQLDEAAPVTGAASILDCSGRKIMPGPIWGTVYRGPICIGPHIHEAHIYMRPQHL